MDTNNSVLVPSSSDPLHPHMVTRSGGSLKCDDRCKSFKYRGHCAHIREASSIFATRAAGALHSLDAGYALSGQASRLRALAGQVIGRPYDLEKSERIWDAIEAIELALNSLGALSKGGDNV